jgi:hypothetical protein
LLAAAGAVREGRAVPRGGRRFRVMLTPGKPIFAATCVANAIAWRNGGTVAILTPSRSGGFAAGVVDLVCAGPVGKQRNGPFPIQWETGEQVEDNALWQRLAMPEACSVQDALVALAPHCSTTAVRDTRDWIVRRRRVLGIAEVTAAQIRGQLNRTLAGYRRHGTSAPRSLSAMTIQQAKNREFDHVIVLWPFTVPNDNEQKRRLLYNAITRAQRSCHVLVQGQPLLDAPPFVPERL